MNKTPHMSLGDKCNGDKYDTKGEKERQALGEMTILV